MTSMWTVRLCVQMGTMELAHSKHNKMDRERRKLRVQTERSEEKRREEGVCQERRAALFLLPITTTGPYSKQEKDPEWPRSSKLSGSTWK